MAKTTMPETVVVIDDEPFNVSFIIDIFESKGLKVITATNVNSAIDKIEKEIYRVLLIDLSVPVFEPLRMALVERGGVYARYPGLFIAERARNRGYRDRQVVIYSVHKEPAVADEANKLGCTYIPKGRTKEIREEIDYILSYDPTTDIQ
jgi:CheY-like chemotaxis protein